MSTYQEMKTKLGSRRGRKPLPAEERERRAKERQAKLRRRMEAKRRAWFVLEHKYSDEFTKIYEEELKSLEKDSNFSSSK